MMRWKGKTSPIVETEPTGSHVDESYYLASQWQLMRRKFRKHHVARASLAALGLLYLGAILAGFGVFLDFCNSAHILTRIFHEPIPETQLKVRNRIWVSDKVFGTKNGSEQFEFIYTF